MQGVLRVPVGIYNAVTLLKYLMDFYEFLTPVSLENIYTYNYIKRMKM